MYDFQISFDKNRVREGSENPWTGHVGKVDVSVSAVTIAMNGFILPRISVERALSFMVRQILADSYAGSKDLGEAQADFLDKIKKLQDGTLAMRTSGDGFDSYLGKVVEAALTKAEYKAKLAEIDKVTYAGDKAAQAQAKREARLDYLETLFNGISEASQAKLKAQADDLRKQAAAASAARKAKLDAIKVGAGEESEI